MSGFQVWVWKELLEISRTWRRFVLPLLLLIMAIVSPVLARITPDLVRSVTSNDPTVIIQIPDPTARDALRQWGQSLGQIVLLGVIVIAGGLVSGDLATGAGQLALVKPLQRRDYILAKVAVLAGYLIVLTIVAAVLCGLLTRGIFHEVAGKDLALLTAVWLVLAITFICVMTLVSTVLHSQTAAAGVGIAIYFLLSLFGIWRPAKEYTPVGLLGALDAIASNKSVALVAPAVSAAIVAVVTLAVAIHLFQRQSIR